MWPGQAVFKAWLSGTRSIKAWRGWRCQALFDIWHLAQSSTGACRISPSQAIFKAWRLEKSLINLWRVSLSQRTFRAWVFAISSARLWTTCRCPILCKAWSYGASWWAAFDKMLPKWRPLPQFCGPPNKNHKTSPQSIPKWCVQFWRFHFVWININHNILVWESFPHWRFQHHHAGFQHCDWAVANRGWLPQLGEYSVEGCGVFLGKHLGVLNFLEK